MIPLFIIPSVVGKLLFRCGGTKQFSSTYEWIRLNIYVQKFNINIDDL